MLLLLSCSCVSVSAPPISTLISDMIRAGTAYFAVLHLLLDPAGLPSLLLLAGLDLLSFLRGVPVMAMHTDGITITADQGLWEFVISRMLASL